MPISYKLDGGIPLFCGSAFIILSSFNIALGKHWSRRYGHFSYQCVK
jgi:hypothetical protein